MSRPENIRPKSQKTEIQKDKEKLIRKMKMASYRL